MLLEGYLDIYDAARRLKVHPDTIRRAIRIGNLKAEKVANAWWMSEEDLDTFAAHRDPKTGKLKKLV